VAVWDTVGSLGIPVHGGKDANRVDIFQFADLVLSPKVLAGFHALAIDEQRADFAPTLWEPREGVSQRWFCGAHSDVGGGGAPRNFFSANSLRWMTARLAARGVLFAPGEAQPDLPKAFQPVHASHLDPPFDLRPHAPRQLPADVHFHPSVQVFLTNFSAYAPDSLGAWLQGASRQLDAARLSE
jgi:glutathione S-transferase